MTATSAVAMTFPPGGPTDRPVHGRRPGHHHDTAKERRRRGQERVPAVHSSRQEQRKHRPPAPPPPDDALGPTTESRQDKKDTCKHKKGTHKKMRR